MERANLYNTEFIPTGSTMLNLAVGGGWATGRIFNLVGDKSTGKTLLAIEALANFTRMFPKGRMKYGEAEAAFDEAYASTLGFPGNVEKPEKPLETVEEFFVDLQKFSELPGPSIYILDSLDALSDASEKAKEIDEGSYGVNKAKKMSELFRRLVQQLSKNNCTLGVISQIRDNIGVMFGESKTRSGGRALDFYSSQIVWLSETGKLTRTIKGQDRVVGVSIKAKVKKCKVGLPFREAEMSIAFGYGVDDEMSMIEWLESIKAYTKEEAKEAKKIVDHARNGKLPITQGGPSNEQQLIEFSTTLKKRCRIEWEMLEEAFRPKTKKYPILV